MEQPKKDKKKVLRQVYNYSSLGIQTGVLIGGGAWLGSYLDDKYATSKPWFTLALVLLFTSIAIYSAIKTLNRWGNQ